MGIFMDAVESNLDYAWTKSRLTADEEKKMDTIMKRGCG